MNGTCEVSMKVPSPPPFNGTSEGPEPLKKEEEEYPPERPTGPSRSASGRDGIGDGDGGDEAPPVRPARQRRRGTGVTLVERSRAPTTRDSADAGPASANGTAASGGSSSEAPASGAGAPLMIEDADALAERWVAAIVAEGADAEAARHHVAKMRKLHGDEAALNSIRRGIANAGPPLPPKPGRSVRSSVAGGKVGGVVPDEAGARVAPRPIAVKPREPVVRFSDNMPRAEWDELEDFVPGRRRGR